MRISVRCALLLTCLSMSSCALLQAPMNLLNSIMGTAVRSSSHAKNDDTHKPFHLEQEEIEKARAVLDAAPMEPGRATVQSSIAAR